MWQNWHVAAWKPWGKEKGGKKIETQWVWRQKLWGWSLVAGLAGELSLHKWFPGMLFILRQFPSLSRLCQLAPRDLLKFQAFLPFHERSRGGLGGTLSSSLPPAINSLGLSSVCSSPPTNVKPCPPCPLPICTCHRLAAFALDLVLFFLLFPVHIIVSG